MTGSRATTMGLLAATSTRESPIVDACRAWESSRGIIECVHGLREPIQFTRHVTDEVYRALNARVHRLNVADQLRGGSKKKKKGRPQFTMGNVVVNNPRDGVVEASVVVHGPARVRAVALRLDGLDERWQATSFSML